MLKNFKIMLIVSVISIICGGQVAEADALWARDANTSTLKPKVDANDNVDIGDGELDANNVYIGDTLFTEYISGTTTEVRDVYLDPNLFVTGDLRVNGGDIGIAADPDLIHMTANNMTVRGVIVSTLDMIVNGGDIGILTDLDLMKLTPNLLTVNGAVKTTGGLKVDGGDIGITADTDLIQLASGALTVNGSLAVAGKITNVTDPDANQDAATKKYVDDNIGSGGGVKQIVNTTTGAKINCTGTIPYDDTIPQNTEGTEVMTLSITPKATTNKLKIDVTVFFTDGGGYNMTAALFQDSTANTLACGMYQNYGSAGDHAGNISFTHFMEAGTASSTTFKVRLGSSTNTSYLNGNNSTRKFGGKLSSSITITEIEP